MLPWEPCSPGSVPGTGSSSPCTHSTSSWLWLLALPPELLSASCFSLSCYLLLLRQFLRPQRCRWIVGHLGLSASPPKTPPVKVKENEGRQRKPRLPTASYVSSTALSTAPRTTPSSFLPQDHLLGQVLDCPPYGANGREPGLSDEQV